MKIINLPLAITSMALPVFVSLGASNVAFAQRGGHGGGGGHMGGGGMHMGGGGMHMGGGGMHMGGGGMHMGGRGSFRGGGGVAHISPGYGNMGAGGQARVYGGRGYGQSAIGPARNSNAINNWHGYGRNYPGHYPGNQANNSLARIYNGHYGNPGSHRYGTGYRGYPYRHFGFGVAFGPYGYSYFPWYGGLGLYGGVGGINRIFGNGIYGSGYYNYGYLGGYPSNGGAVTVYQQPPQTAQPQEPVEDYVPQVNETDAQLAATDSGNAILGITIDGRYPKAAVIRAVTPGSPAEKAGLRPADMIASIDNREMQSPSDVVNLISGMKPGDQIHIQFVRPIPRSQVREAAPEVQPGAAEATPTPAPEPDTSSPPPPPVAEPTPAN